MGAFFLVALLGFCVVVVLKISLLITAIKTKAALDLAEKRTALLQRVLLSLSLSFFLFLSLFLSKLLLPPAFLSRMLW